MTTPISPLRFVWLWCRLQLRIQRNAGVFAFSFRRQKVGNAAKRSKRKKQRLTPLIALLLIGFYIFLGIAYSCATISRVDALIPMESVMDSLPSESPILVSSSIVWDLKSLESTLEFQFRSQRRTTPGEVQDPTSITMTRADRVRLLGEIERDRFPTRFDSVGNDHAGPPANGRDYLEALFATRHGSSVRDYSERDVPRLVDAFLDGGSGRFQARDDSPFGIGRFTGARAAELLDWLSLYFLFALIALAAGEGVSSNNPMMVAPEGDIARLGLLPIPTWILFLLPLIRRSLLAVLTLMMGMAPTAAVLYTLGLPLYEVVAGSLVVMLSFSLCVASCQVCFQFVGRFSSNPWARRCCGWLQVPAFAVFCLITLGTQLPTVLAQLRRFVLAHAGSFLPPSLLVHAFWSGNASDQVVAVGATLALPAAALLAIHLLSRGGLPVVAEAVTRRARHTRDWSLAALRLVRDRGYLVQTTIMPIVLFGFYTLMVREGSTLSGRRVTALVYGACAFVMLGSLFNLAAHEGPGLWLSYSAPCRVGRVFLPRIRFWIKVTLGYAMTAFAILFFLRVDGLVWSQVLSILLGLPGLCFIAASISFAAFPPPSGQGIVRVSTLRSYQFMWLASLYPQAALASSPGAEFTTPILFNVLALVLWQGCGRRLPYYLDPERKPPAELTSGNAMLWCMMFLWVQSMVTMIVIQIGRADPAKLRPVHMVVSYAAAGVLTSILAAWWYRRRELFAMARSSRSVLSSLPEVALCTLVAIAFGAGYLWLVRPHFPELFHTQVTLEDRAWLIVLTVGLAPPLEEFLFRRLLLVALLRDLSPRWAIPVGALVFAAVHPIISFAPVLGLGLACSWLYWRTGRIIVPIIVHALYNAMVVWLNG